VAKAAGIHAPDVILAELSIFATKVSGEKFVPWVAPSYRELAAGVAEGSIGIAWLPPILAIESEESGGGAVIALPARKGMASYHTAFITRRGGPKSLAECTGRSVGWIDRESASGYIIPRLHLAALGFDPAKFFASETFVGNHVAMVDAVLAGRIDVGVTFCNFDPTTKQILNAGWTEADGRSDRPVQLIDTAGPIPNDAIVASTKLSPTVRATLTRWLLAINPEEKTLFQRLVRATEFKVIPQSHFEPLKHMVRTARVRGFSMPPPG
jgi:phosphate/phosphite/phosphonate ABC transporter binding protein